MFAHLSQEFFAKNFILVNMYGPGVVLNQCNLLLV